MKGTTSFIFYLSYVIRNQSLSSNYRDDFRDEIEADKGWGLILEQRHSGTSDMTFTTPSTNWQRHQWEYVIFKYYTDTDLPITMVFHDEYYVEIINQIVKHFLRRFL